MLHDLLLDLEHRRTKDRDRFSGKTARIKATQLFRDCYAAGSYWNSDRIANNPVLEINRTTQSRDGFSIIPVTALDHDVSVSLLEGFNASPFHSSRASNRVPLGFNGVWKEIPEALELSHYSKSISYNRNSRCHTLAFDVPVIGNLIVPCDPDPPSKRRHTRHTASKAMQWHGGSYDCNTIWVLAEAGKSSFQLREFGPLYLEKPTFHDPATRPLNFAIRHSQVLLHHPSPLHLPSASHLFIRRRPMSECRCSRGQAGGGSRLWHSHPNTYSDKCESASAGSLPRNGMVIDLFRPHLITAVGIAGEAPRVSLFRDKMAKQLARKRLTCSRQNGARYYGRRARTWGPGVWVVDDSKELCWVTSYSLYARTHGLWVYVGAYVGNHNATEEQVSFLSPASPGGGITARFLKLVPDSHHGARAVCRLAVYGQVLVGPSESSESRSAAAAAAAAAATVSQPECVRYILRPAAPPRRDCWGFEAKWGGERWDKLEWGGARNALRREVEEEWKGAVHQAWGNDREEEEEEEDGGVDRWRHKGLCNDADGDLDAHGPAQIHASANGDGLAAHDVCSDSEFGLQRHHHYPGRHLPWVSDPEEGSELEAAEEDSDGYCKLGQAGNQTPSIDRHSCAESESDTDHSDKDFYSVEDGYCKLLVDQELDWPALEVNESDSVHGEAVGVHAPLGSASASANRHSGSLSILGDALDHRGDTRPGGEALQVGPGPPGHPSHDSGWLLVRTVGSILDRLVGRGEDHDHDAPQPRVARTMTTTPRGEDHDHTQPRVAWTMATTPCDEGQNHDRDAPQPRVEGLDGVDHDVLVASVEDHATLQPCVASVELLCCSDGASEEGDDWVLI